MRQILFSIDYYEHIESINVFRRVLTVVVRGGGYSVKFDY
jgi:hypothetical protein